jgi:hypothetical protein
MVQEIGESREAWGRSVMQMAEDFANQASSDGRPFWIVYAAKADRGLSNIFGHGTFKQAFKAYYQKPPVMLGILVWYVDKSKSEFRFCPELSAPPDVPVDPTLLSDKAEDASARVMEQGQKLQVLRS